MKKLLVGILALLLMVGTVNAEGKVKVYIYQAGGCPYCEAEIEYLEGLDSYNKKFEIVTKELYVDHVDWAQGSDYKTGKKVAELFLDKGFEDASYQSTPFVVISDVYAAAGYNTELEEIIETAYEQGDKDVVACVEDGGDAECLGGEKVEVKTSPAGIVVAVVSALALVGAIIYVFKVKKEDEEVLPEKKEEVKEEVKKVTKKAPVKKTTKTTKTTKKTTKK